MSIYVDIEKDLGSFVLKVKFHTENDRIGILGASGSGKSMTLRSIAGIVKPDKGIIKVNDRVFFDSEKKINLKTKDRKVGYLFQNYALFPNMTVEKNISAGLRGSDSDKKKRVREMLERFELKGLEKRLPSELSGGQQQRVALARILAYMPSVILLDEPFSALDVFLKDHMQQELMDSLSDYPGTVIMVSHDRDEIYRFSDKLLIVDKGSVVSSGGTKEIFRDPWSMAAAKLTGCKNFSKVEYIDEHHIYLKTWGIDVYSEKFVPKDIKYLGYRAHDFIPVWGESKTNSIPFRLLGKAELQFERKYYIKAEHSEGMENMISWFVQKKDWITLDMKGKPDYLKMDEDKMLFLT